MTLATPLPLLGFVPGSGDLILDFDGVLEFGLFVEGVSRSGKTNLVRVFLEQTYPLAQQLIFDPEGEYGTLRSDARPYLIVGRGGDVAIEPAAAPVQLLVRKLVEQRVSTVFDLSEYDDDEQRVIVAAACEELVRLPVGHAGEIIVVIEEVQDFAPESGSGRASALAAVRRLSKRGAKRGVRLVGSSQRVADVSKGVVTQLKNKAIGGTDQSDLVRALEELGLPREMRKDVADLPQGEFFVKGPAVSRHAVRVRVPKSETAPEKRRRGQGAAPRPPAPAMIAALASALADVPREAAEEQATVESLRRRVADLGTELQRARAAAPAPVVDQGAIERAVARAREEAARLTRSTLNDIRLALFDLGRAQLNEASERLTLLVGQVEAAQDAAVVVAPASPVVSMEPGVVPGRPFTVIAKPQAADRRSPSSGDAPQLSSGAREVLDALAFYRSIGQGTPTRRSVAGYVGVSPTKSTWRAYLAPLRAENLIEDLTDDRMRLTPAGQRLARAPERPVTRAELHARWLSQLSAGAQLILRELIKAYPHERSLESLAAAAGVDRGVSTFRAYMAEIRGRELVDEKQKGLARASELLFPEGLR